MNEALIPPSTSDPWLEIGTIVAAQGLKGEVRVYSTSDFPERFERPGTRWLQAFEASTPQPIELLQGRAIPGKKLYVLQLAGIEDRDRAEALRGYKLLVPQSDRPQLPEDEYHVADLLGLEAIHQLTGETLGVVTNLFCAGQDLLEVRLHQQPQAPQSSPQPDLSTISRKSKRRKAKPKKPKPATVLIPFVKEIVPLVDLETKHIEILPPPGLLDVN